MLCYAMLCLVRDLATERGIVSVTAGFPGFSLRGLFLFFRDSRPADLRVLLVLKTHWSETVHCEYFEDVASSATVSSWCSVGILNIELA